MSAPQVIRRTLLLSRFFFLGGGFRSYSLWSSRGKKWGGGGIFQEPMPLMRGSALYLILVCEDEYSGRIIPAMEIKMLPFSLFQNFQCIYKDLTDSLTTHVNFRASGCSVLKKFQISCGIHKTHCCVQKTRPKIANKNIAYKSVWWFNKIP